jgi:hypothetical protein
MLRDFTAELKGNILKAKAHQILEKEYKEKSQ